MSRCGRAFSVQRAAAGFVRLSAFLDMPLVFRAEGELVKVEFLLQNQEGISVDFMVVAEFLQPLALAPHRK